MSPISGIDSRRLPPRSAPRPISSAPKRRGEFLQLRIADLLAPQDQHAMPVDRPPQRFKRLVR